MFEVITNHPIALESRDHTHPHGTKDDNSRNHKFNEKLYKLFGNGNRQIHIMDLGCAGGGFVKDCLDDHHIAIGLEGSNFSMLAQRAEWATIPDNLFLCDVTKPFQINHNGVACKFDVITAWELLEHLPEEDLPQFFKNCDNHLTKTGLFIASVSPNPEFWHVCVHDKSWWLNLVDKLGWIHKLSVVAYFGDDWVRGPLQGARNSFHLVLQRKQ